MKLTIWTEKKTKDDKTSTQHYCKFLRWEFIEPTLRFTTCKSTFFFVCAQFSVQISRCQAEVYAGETEIVDEAARRN